MGVLHDDFVRPREELGEEGGLDMRKHLSNSEARSQRGGGGLGGYVKGWGVGGLGVWGLRGCGVAGLRGWGVGGLGGWGVGGLGGM